MQEIKEKWLGKEDAKTKYLEYRDFKRRVIKPALKYKGAIQIKVPYP
ncbi:hypothetical protein [Aminipila luticellarii]